MPGYSQKVQTTARLEALDGAAFACPLAKKGNLIQVVGDFPRAEVDLLEHDATGQLAPNWAAIVFIRAVSAHFYDARTAAVHFCGTVSGHFYGALFPLYAYKITILYLYLPVTRSMKRPVS